MMIYNNAMLIIANSQYDLRSQLNLSVSCCNLWPRTPAAWRPWLKRGVVSVQSWGRAPGSGPRTGEQAMKLSVGKAGKPSG